MDILAAAFFICAILLMLMFAVQEFGIWRKARKSRQIVAAQQRQQVDAQLQQAKGQIDQLFRHVGIRMEEQAGLRQPGQQRLGDNLYGDWRTW